MKKVVVKVDLHDEKSKQKALKAVSGLAGIDSISVDMKEQNLTVAGSIDPVDVATRLRKCGRADILSVGPAVEEKKEEPKKEEPKKEEPKKEEPKKEEEKEEPKKEEAKKEEPKKEEEKKEEKEDKTKELIHEHVGELVRAYRAYNPEMTTYYYVQSAEENPNYCAIL